eukprot:4843447-Pyramimonas_sp.AAC.1
MSMLCRVNNDESSKSGDITPLPPYKVGTHVISFPETEDVAQVSEPKSHYFTSTLEFHESLMLLEYP